VKLIERVGKRGTRHRPPIDALTRLPGGQALVRQLAILAPLSSPSHPAPGEGRPEKLSAWSAWRFADDDGKVVLEQPLRRPIMPGAS
jgi:hypothetical protein